MWLTNSDMNLSMKSILMGGCSIDATGEPLTDHAIEQALHSDAVLMGIYWRKYKHFPMV